MASNSDFYTDIRHKHRIIPGHMGGTYTPTNVVLLTVAEHAEAHKILFETHGYWQDRVAWQGLARIIGHEEVIRQINVEAHRGRPQSAETRAKRSVALLGNKNARGGKGRKRSAEHTSKLIAVCTGRKRTFEARTKMSVSAKAAWQRRKAA